MKKQYTESLEAVHTHTHTHTGTLVNKGLLSEPKKYRFKKDSDAISVSILDTG